MNWKHRLIIYLLIWLGLGIVCSAIVGQINEVHHRPSQWFLWAFLPWFLFLGLLAATHTWSGGFWCLYVFGVFLAVHGWYWFTVKSTRAWVVLYWMFLLVAVVGAWGFRQYLSGLDS